MEYLIKNMANILLLDYETKEPLLFIPEALFSNINLSGELKSSRGGTEGLTLISWNSGASVSFLLQTPILSMEFLEISTKGKLNKGKFLTHEIEVIELDSEGRGELKYTPSEEKDIYIFSLDKSGRFIKKPIFHYDLEENILKDLQPKADWFLVFYYHKAFCQKLDIGKTMMSGYYSIIGNVNIYNKETSETEVFKFEFPKINIEQLIDLNLLNSSNPNQRFNLQCQALVENEKDKVLLRLVK